MKSGWIKEMIEDLEDAVSIENGDNNLRFTVTLNERNKRRLEYLCRRYGIKRAEMARKLLIASLGEAEESLGLHVTEDAMDGKFAVTDYYRYLSGQITLDDLFNGHTPEGDVE